MAKKALKPTLSSSGGKQARSEQDRLGLERVIFFSDAVFAIAITLLALDVRLPSLGQQLTDNQLVHALLALGPKYISYAISFFVIGTFWIGHHRKFQFILRYDGNLLLLNIFC